MKKVIKFGGLPLLIVIGMAVLWALTMGVSTGKTKSTVQFIQQHFNSSGELIDYYNDIGVKDVKDIHVVIKNNKVTLTFGKLRMDWKMKDFVKQENQELLKTIYIEMRKDKTTGKLRLFYKGEEIERWVS